MTLVFPKESLGVFPKHLSPDYRSTVKRSPSKPLIIVPHSWNGAFIVYAHGYDADYRDIKPYPSDITPANIASKLAGADAILQIPLTLGYAVGTTTYRSVGWAIDDTDCDSRFQ